MEKIFAMSVSLSLLVGWFWYLRSEILYDLKKNYSLPTFKNPPKPPKKRYRWNIYWHVWDEWDAKEKCYMSEFPPPMIVSRRKPQRPAQSQPKPS